MSAHQDNQYPSAPSLAQHFDAPHGYAGHFGWLCGYSADAAFLNDAAERFTRLTAAQRTRQGRIALAAFLDPGNPAITVLAAPGVAHLPILDIAAKPFRLLHAKVALLGFQNVADSKQWLLRLIVSTGNWTSQTLEESLDLAWSIAVSSEALQEHGEAAVKAFADIKAAQQFLQWLEKWFDTRLLDTAAPGKFNETRHAREQVAGWLALIPESPAGRARFLDSRNEALLDQLPARIRACSSGVARNYLAMGSGFYESVADPNQSPKVPMAIVRALQNEALLTRKPDIDLFVNPQACQAVAASVMALEKQGVTVRPAAQPTAIFGSSMRRSLHAKFLFSANHRDNSNACSSAWVYLGSGNLTHPGFAEKMHASAGNLEAGVVFAPSSLYWTHEPGSQARHAVESLLPIQWDEAVDSQSDRLSPGDGMVPRTTCFVAAPVAWLAWVETEGAGELRTTEAMSDDWVVLDPAGSACLKSATGFRWPAAQPRQVRCRWTSDQGMLEADIPVVDASGRIAANPLAAIGIEEALWQLADFPLPPDDDEDSDGEEKEDDSGGSEAKGKPHAAGRPLPSYPIRQMMELIEGIAEKQTQMAEMDWEFWCHRLEQTLVQARDTAAVAAFRALGLNPLSPLRQAPFRPSFAETRETLAGQQYEESLARVEVTWTVDQLHAMGGAQ